MKGEEEEKGEADNKALEEPTELLKEGRLEVKDEDEPPEAVREEEEDVEDDWRRVWMISPSCFTTSTLA